MKHYYWFPTEEQRVLDKSAWESLRESNDERLNAFSLEQSKELWERKCRDADEYRFFAEQIARHLPREANVYSFGIGKGFLEWNLRRVRRDIGITGTDYTERTLNRLREYTDEIQFRVFDLLKDDYSELNCTEKDYCILFRISTEFSKSEWRDIIRRMGAAGIKHVLFVPTEEMNATTWMQEMWLRIKTVISGGDHDNVWMAILKKRVVRDLGKRLLYHSGAIPVQKQCDLPN